MSIDPAQLHLGVPVDDAVASSLTVVDADPVFASPFRVGEGAATAFGLAAATAAEIGTRRGLPAQTVRASAIDGAAALLGFLLCEIDGEARDRTNAGNPTVALYPTADDRWIHLHGGFPGLQSGTLRVLGLDDGADAAQIGAAAAGWQALDLEDALAAAGLCGAMVRTPDEWDAHPAGAAVNRLGAVTITRTGDGPVLPLGEADRPLGGVRVLDLARVLAGPTCGRTLAAHGAQVLRVNGPANPDVELFTIETGHGKRSAHVDLDTADGVDTLWSLVDDAHVFVQGYRPGVIARRGFGPDALAARRPGIVTATISCYGPDGPFADRPGWEQLAQATSGLAAVQGSPNHPTLIPAAACDYTTGALAAWGIAEALRRQQTEGGSWHVEASLCQTAAWFRRLGLVDDPDAAVGLGDRLDHRIVTESPWGTLRHLGPGVELSHTPARWEQPSSPPGTHDPAWW